MPSGGRNLNHEDSTGQQNLEDFRGAQEERDEKRLKTEISGRFAERAGS